MAAMAKNLTKYAATKLLNKELQGTIDQFKHNKVAGKDDPFFEEITLKNGKKKKVKKQLPDFIPEHDARILNKVKKRAYSFDVKFSWGPLRLGWSSVIGLIPTIGDVIDLIMGIYIYMTCLRTKAPLGRSFHVYVAGLLFMDFLIGLLPIAGDLIDAVVRPNIRMAAMLEKRIIAYYGKTLSEEEQRYSVLDMSEEDHVALANALDTGVEPTRPAQAMTRPPRGGWLGGNSQRQRQPDEEMAEVKPQIPVKNNYGKPL